MDILREERQKQIKELKPGIISIKEAEARELLIRIKPRALKIIPKGLINNPYFLN